MKVSIAEETYLIGRSTKYLNSNNNITVIIPQKYETFSGR